MKQEEDITGALDYAYVLHKGTQKDFGRENQLVKLTEIELACNRITKSATSPNQKEVPVCSRNARGREKLESSFFCMRKSSR